MQGLLNVNIDTPNGAAMTVVDGSLSFDQDEPILIDSIRRTLYASDPISSAQYIRYGMPALLEFNAARKGKCDWF